MITKAVNKVLKGIEKMNRVDQKLTLQKLKVSMVHYQNLPEPETKSLSKTAKDLFHLLETFSKNKNI